MKNRKTKPVVFKTTEGRERYYQYIDIYGKPPEIKTIFDAYEYGLITRDELKDRYRKACKIRILMDMIFGTIGLLLFLAWTCFTLYCIHIGAISLELAFSRGLLTVIVGAVSSLLIIRRGWQDRCNLRNEKTE